MKRFSFFLIVAASLSLPAGAGDSTCSSGACGPAATATTAPVRSALRRLAARRPVRTALGKLFGRCGSGACQ